MSRFSFCRAMMTFVSVLGLNIASPIAAASDEPAPSAIALAEITITPTESGVSIMGTVVGLAPGEVEAKLSISKSDLGGSSDLAQGRRVSVNRGDRHVIGSTGLSMQPGAHLSVTMTVMQDGTEIAVAHSRLGL